ncbi:GHKL domain-containing protein [Acidaminobacter sp. JC074]|uniref:cache domain-containing protein n=1 Tax=Acidaminobacter sp. JC074 TaxID=2530199 RepID=UPI001F0E3F48|nr:cache domain-containing protein [Acidaminobacter sp. JC074]MCH4890688.1 GHKL domain-containing protein [Acidaminobacter sp. JC074]
MSKNWKLYHRIRKSYRSIIALIIIGIVTVVVLTIYSYVSFRDNLITKEQEQLLTIAKTTSKTLEDFLDEKKKDSTIMVQTIVDDYHDSLKKDEITDFISYALNNYFKIQNGKIYQIQFYDEYDQLIYSTIQFEETLEVAADTKPFQVPKGLDGPVIGEIFELENKDLAIDITTPVVVDGEHKGHLRLILKMEMMYRLYLEEIRIGSKGYASLKDSDGVLIMHPKNEDIGVNVMEARKSEFPDYDWSELETLVELQKLEESGTGIYHSIWYQDASKKRVKKFSAFSHVKLENDFWILTVSMDYKELSDLATNYFYNNIVIIGLVPIVLVILLFYILNLRKNIVYLENEQKYIKQVKALNKDLEKDIEERKELEKALYASKERFKRLFNAGTDLIFVLHRNPTNETYEIIRVNDMACKKFNKSREALIDKNFLSLASNTTQIAMDNFSKCIEDDELSVFEMDLILAGGITPFELSGQVFSLDNKTLMMLIARDISKKKAQEEQLERDRGLLIYKFRLVAMGEMIANIAHQWRQPLGSLSLMISNLDDAYDHHDLNEDYFKSTMNNAQNIIQNMSAIIDDFRYFFNPRQEKTSISIKNQIESSLEMVKDRITIGEVNISLEDRSKSCIYGFENQLSQVVLNIINNSIDAMKDMTNRKIDIIIDECDHRIRVMIFNNGENIPDEVLPKVFNPYFTTKANQDGTGIGLYMTKMIIESNFGGTIGMFNTEDGVCTEINLPIGE